MTLYSLCSRGSFGKGGEAWGDRKKGVMGWLLSSFFYRRDKFLSLLWTYGRCGWLVGWLLLLLLLLLCQRGGGGGWGLVTNILVSGW